MVLRQVDAATVVGVAVVGCGETVGRIVGFVVGDGRGRGRGLGRPLGAASITATSCKRHKVRACMMMSCRAGRLGVLTDCVVLTDCALRTLRES